jgi:hypothetical protein
MQVFLLLLFVIYLFLKKRFGENSGFFFPLSRFLSDWQIVRLPGLVTTPSPCWLLPLMALRGTRLVLGPWSIT